MPLPTNRPESWNFKMLNGKPLILDKHFEQLLANGMEWGTGSPPKIAAPVVKLFLPHVRWYLVALDADLDITFAVVADARKLPMFGVVSLADIVAARLTFGPGSNDGLRPERDMYVKLDQPWIHYYEEHVRDAADRRKAVL